MGRPGIKKGVCPRGGKTGRGVGAWFAWTGIGCGSNLRVSIAIVTPIPTKMEITRGRRDGSSCREEKRLGQRVSVACWRAGGGGGGGEREKWRNRWRREKNTRMKERRRGQKKEGRKDDREKGELYL